MKTKLKVLAPFIVFLIIQLVVAIIGSNVCSVMAAMKLGEAATDQTALMEATLELYQTNVSKILFLVHVINALVMILWIRKYTKKEPYTSVKESFAGNKAGMIILGGIGVETCILAIMNVLALIFPGMFDAFNELMQAAGIGSLEIFSIIATVILAPIGEELCFRGLTYKFTRRAGASVLVANIVQAVLFGVMHLNLVQGVYAAFMGLFLGYVLIKYNSIWLCIFMHMVINGMATLIGYLPIQSLSDGAYIAILAVAAVVGLVGFFLLDKKNAAVVPAWTIEEVAEEVVSEEATEGEAE